MLLSLKTNTSIWKMYFLYSSEFEHKYRSLKVYFKYTSEFENRYIYLESLLEVYFWVGIKIRNLESPPQAYFKFRKSISSILLTQKRNRNAFQKQVQSILEVYFITKLMMDLKYTWHIQI